ncbi:gibberellin 3-beta-dioxygenase 1-like protein [Tanacetum coccineum]
MAFDLRPTKGVLPWSGNANMAFDLQPMEDVLLCPGNANMAFDLRPTKDVLPWPGNANMAFDLRPTEDVLPWPGNANMAFDLVINHGVPLALIEKPESESRRLFALLTDEKHKVLKSGNGVTGYGTARISQFFDKCMWYEGFTIMGSCVEDAKVLWPHDYKNFCDTMDAYQNEMKLLTHKLLHLMLPTLNVTQEEMNWAISAQDSQAVLQLNSYPSCPNPIDAIGLAPHTDPLLLTLLYQGGINGLEIFVEGLGWSSVNPVDGALVVNIGDLLHILYYLMQHFRLSIIEPW